MSDTEELLRGVLRQRAEEAPGMHDLQLDTPSPRSRWRWMAPLAVAAVTAALVLGVVSLSNWHTGTTTTASVPDPDLSGVLYTVIYHVNQYPKERTVLFTTDRDGNSSRVSTSDMDMYSADWSPDGTQIAFTGLRSGEINPGLYVMSADGTGITSVLEDGRLWPADVSWSADGSSIYFASSNDHGMVVKNIDVATGINTTVTNSGDLHFAVSPRDDQLAIIRATTNEGDDEESLATFVLSTADGSVIEEMPGSGRTPAWSPDGQKLAYADEQDQWIIEDMTSGSTVMLDPPSEGMYIGEVAWGPDENYVLIETVSPDSRMKLFVVDLSAGTYQQVVDMGEGRLIGDISWGHSPASTSPADE